MSTLLRGFLRVEATERVSLADTGAISKTIVELHGGTIEGEGVVGRGSTFWFALPLAEPTT